MFAGTDADDFLDRLDPDLAIADGSGASGVADDVDNAIDVLIGAATGEKPMRNARTTGAGPTPSRLMAEQLAGSVAEISCSNDAFVAIDAQTREGVKEA